MHQLQEYNSQNKDILPKALDKFSPPFTLPSPVTLPPAFCILSSSLVSSGLWSIDISNAIPFLHTTQRESPTFATVRLLPLTNATIAVVPLSYPTLSKYTTI